MSATFPKVVGLVKVGKVRASRHALRRLLEHRIAFDELLANIDTAEVLEDYPTYYTGPSFLLLHRIEGATVAHAVWGIEHGTEEPAVFITTYRPDTVLCSDDFRKRKP